MCSLLWGTIAITEGQSPPKELYLFCHLTAVAGYRRDRVAGPSFVAGKPENTAGTSFRGTNGPSGPCGLQRGPCLGHHRVLTCALIFGGNKDAHGFGVY
jgi:hypothetical protein